MPRPSLSTSSVFLPWAIALIGSLGAVGCDSGASSSDASVGTGGATAKDGATGATGAGGMADAGAATGGHGTGGSAGATGTGGQAGNGGGPAGVGGHAGHTGGATGAGGMAGSGGRAGAGGHAGSTGGTGGGGAGVGGHAGGKGAAGAGGQVGGTAGMGPEAPGGRVSGYGQVSFNANSKAQIIRLQTTLTVPAKPPASGTLFLWPGLQPGGANYDPIDNGVLQPVLTWGDSCAPGNQPRAYSTWWISAQYVNTFGSDPGYMGCYGGATMSVAVGDDLNIDMRLAGTSWTQTVTDEQTGQSVDFSIDMMGQTQNWAYFIIEEYSSAPVSTVVFTNTTITFGASDPGDCKLSGRGQNDFVSVPVASSNGLQCTVAQIILRAQGIP